MAGIYTTLSLAEAVDLLGKRLYDPDHITWTSEELVIYVQQALRTYNAFTANWRAQASFDTTLAEPFYDLPTVLPTLRTQDYTVLEAVNQLAYQLIELPPEGGAWVGTDQFSLPEFLSALKEARDAFLLETASVLTTSTVVVSPAPASGRVDLDEDIIALRRLAWRTSDGIVTLLRRTDEWALTSFRPNWKTAAARPPIAYSVGVTPPLIVQLAPITSTAGQLKLITIDRGSEPDLLVVDQSLGVPNDWAWVVIFGALVILLRRDALSTDIGRAGYCEARWKHGIELAKNTGVVLSAQIEGVPCQITSVHDADAYSAGWAMVPGTPKRIVTAGHTLVGTWPPPGVPVGGGAFTVTLDVVRNAPIPVDLSDILQIGPELLDGIMGYAQHLAVFKGGGPGQVDASMGLFQQFLELTGQTLNMQRASQPDRSSMIDQTTQDERVVAYAMRPEGDR